MDRESFRKYLMKQDAETLEDRCRRHEELGTSTYRTLPELLWEYLVEADELYVEGHFVAAMLLCGTITEIVLADQLASAAPLVPEELEQFNLHQMAILCHRLGRINDEEKHQIDELRRVRNALVHANIGQLRKRAKKHYPDLDASFAASFYLSSFGGEGIAADLQVKMRVLQSLTLRLYGSQE